MNRLMFELKVLLVRILHDFNSGLCPIVTLAFSKKGYRAFAILYKPQRCTKYDYWWTITSPYGRRLRKSAFNTFVHHARVGKWYKQWV
jgi:hypothetical protein